ncbi:MAG: hypothetical protein PVI37_10515, partial [Gammaproteobacteria bacterium]
MKTRTLFAGVALLTSLPAVSALAMDNSWTSKGPEGGELLQLSVERANSVVYVETKGSHGAIFRSDDGGATWSLFQHPNQGTGYGIFADQAQTGIVFGLGTRPYEATDSVTAAYQYDDNAVGYNLRAMGVSPDGSTIYLGDLDHGISVSTDSGQTFANRSSGLPTSGSGYVAIDRIVVDWQNSAIAYALADDGAVYKTANSGSSWSQLGATLSTDLSTRLFIDPNHGDRVYVVGSAGLYASFGGAAWSKVINASTDSVAVDAVDSSVMYAILADGYVYKSTDTGATWTSTGAKVPVTHFHGSLISVGGSNSALLAATQEGMWRSTDGGISWAASNSGLVATYVRSITQSSVDPTNMLLTTDYMGTYYSADSGDTFTASTGTANTRSRSTAWSPSDGSLAFVARLNGLDKTTDAGTTWTNVSSASFESISIDPADENHMLGGTSYQGIKVSNDGGATWTASNTGLQGDEDVRQIAFDPTDSSIVYIATFNRGLAKSTDGGASWTPIGSSVGTSTDAIAINPSNPSELFAGTFGGGFGRTDDAGTTWTAVGANFNQNIDPGVSALAFDPDNPAIIYAASSMGVFRSIDDGATWTELPTGGLPFSSVDGNDFQALLLDAGDASRVLVSIRHSGVYEQVVAVDGKVAASGPSAPVAPGEAASVTLDIQNASSVDSADMTAEVTLDSALSVASATATKGNCSVSGSAVTCDLGALKADSSAQVTLEVSAGTEGSYTSSVAVTSYEHEANSSDNSDSFTVDVQAKSSG